MSMTHAGSSSVSPRVRAAPANRQLTNVCGGRSSKPASHHEHRGKEGRAPSWLSWCASDQGSYTHWPPRSLVPPPKHTYAPLLLLTWRAWATAVTLGTGEDASPWGCRQAAGTAEGLAEALRGRPPCRFTGLLSSAAGAAGAALLLLLCLMGLRDDGRTYQRSPPPGNGQWVVQAIRGRLLDNRIRPPVARSKRGLQVGNLLACLV